MADAIIHHSHQAFNLLIQAKDAPINTPLELLKDKKVAGQNLKAGALISPLALAILENEPAIPSTVTVIINSLQQVLV